jgi:molecular chaperone HscB
VNINGNYYELFGLPESYSVNIGQLAVKYRELQKEAHPDRFVHASERDKRLSIQYSTYINEAYQCLRSPLLRAGYLLRARGYDYKPETNTASDMAFLMEQMELREELAEVDKQVDQEAELDRIAADISHRLEKSQDGFSEALASDNLSRAAELLAKMQFIDKLRSECDHKIAELLDY